MPGRAVHAVPRLLALREMKSKTFARMKLHLPIIKDVEANDGKVPHFRGVLAVLPA